MFIFYINYILLINLKMEYNFKSEGNLETVNDNTSMKVPNFVLKENNHHTPLNYFENNSNPKNVPSPIYEYFDTSQKFLKNSSERNFAKSIHSLLSTKGAEISPQSKGMSLTPNFDDNFFGIKGQSPSPNGNGSINKEINEYLKSKQHLLTQNYKDNISENNIQLQKERIVNTNSMNQNLIDMTPEVGEEDEGFYIENEFEQKQMIDFNMNQNNVGNEIFHNDNFPSNIQMNNQPLLNNLNIPHININNNNYNQIQQQPQSKYLMNNSVKQLNNNNSTELNYNFQNIQSTLPNKHNKPQNNPYFNAQMDQQMFHSNNQPPNNQFIPQNMTNNFHNNNFFQQQQETIGTQSHQQMQQLQFNNNNNNMSMNPNMGINNDSMQNIQNYSISHLNPECYIFERFGKRGWQCEKCNNFNFECKFILFFISL